MSAFAKQDCPDCRGSGWCGDMGPGIVGNREYHPCHCIASDRVVQFEKNAIDELRAENEQLKKKLAAAEAENEQLREWNGMATLAIDGAQAIIRNPVVWDDFCARILLDLDNALNKNPIKYRKKQRRSEGWERGWE